MANLTSRSRYGRAPEKVASRVARDIVRDVVSRQLDVGTPLDLETRMLEHFGVSRASLCEALRVLEVHGIISIRPGPGGGAFVAGPTSEDFGRMSTLFYQVMGVTMNSVLEARLILEPFIAANAANRYDQDLNEQLLDIVERHAAAEEDDLQWLQVTDEFHAAVCKMSGNPLLNLLTASLKDIYTARVSLAPLPKELRGTVTATHGRIARAITDGNAEVASTLMRDHMQSLAVRAAQDNPGVMAELIDWG